jgi:hypothetical protein
MSSISGVAGYSSMALAQVSARVAPVDAQRKADALHAVVRAKDGGVSGKTQAKNMPGKAEENTITQSREKPSLPRETEAFSSSASLLQERAATWGSAAVDSQKRDGSVEENVSSDNGMLQEKMLQQVLKTKEAYSHIQAHTGDKSAGQAGVDLTV